MSILQNNFPRNNVIINTAIQVVKLPTSIMILRFVLFVILLLKVTLLPKFFNFNFTLLTEKLPISSLFQRRFFLFQRLPVIYGDLLQLSFRKFRYSKKLILSLKFQGNIQFPNLYYKPGLECFAVYWSFIRRKFKLIYSLIFK